MFYFFKESGHVKMLNKLFTLLLVCLSFKSQAQVFYSTDPNYLKVKTEQNNILSDYQATYPDTSITEQANYFPRNYMGNMGLASPDYIWRYGTEDLGFRFVQSPLTIDRFTEKEVSYYRSKGPYASLNGIAGSKQFQVFKLLFTHTYRDKVNITVRFNRYTSKGFYNKQQTYTNNFYLSSNYTTKKKRAGYYFYILNNGNKNQENGGIQDGQLTDSSMIFDKALFRVNLSNANRDNREIKAMINPWLRLNKNDSTATLYHYLQLKSRFSNTILRYKDLGIASDKVYNIAYLDTSTTIDSSHVRKFSNELAYSFLTVDNRSGFSIGYRNEINQVRQKIDSVFINHMITADLVHRTDIKPKDSLDRSGKFLETKLAMQYIFNGPAAGNYKGEANFMFTLNQAKKRNIFLDILYEKRSPDYICNTWVSNHFLWFNNGLNPQEQSQARLGINLNQVFSASVFYQSLTNYLYFNEYALPRQYSGAIRNLGLNLNFTKIFFKHLGVSLNHVYQKTSSPAYIRVPQNATTAKLFYNASLSKNNLLLQIGAQLQVYESFVAYSYMPSTQVFYLQNEFKTDRYPYVDVYLSARIRPVSFFVKVENVLQGLSGPNYSFVPGYYQVDRAFRLGITWMFFD